MPPKKGGRQKQTSNRQTAPTYQSASDGPAVVTAAPGRHPPRNRSSSGSDRLPSSESDRLPSPPRGSVLAGSNASADLLDKEMDEVARRIEQGERTWQDLEDRQTRAKAAIRSDQERLRRLLAVHDGAALIDPLATAPARVAPDPAPATDAPTRSPAEVNDVRLLADAATVRGEREKRLNALLSMHWPDDPLRPARTDALRSAAVPASSKRPKAVHEGVPSSAMALINSAGAHDEVFITGHSMGLPTQAVTEELAATYLSKYLSFADSRPEYEYVPCAPGSEPSANALVANLRVALQSSHPTPATIAWISFISTRC